MLFLYHLATINYACLRAMSDAYTELANGVLLLVACIKGRFSAKPQKVKHRVGTLKKKTQSRDRIDVSLSI
jgi:hypothetical protein